MKEQWEKIPQSTRFLVGFLLAVLAALFLVSNVALPLESANATKESELRQSEVKLAAIKTFAAENGNYEEYLRVRQTEFDASKQRIPDTVSITELTGEYAALAKKNSLNFLSVKLPTEIKQKEKNGLFAVPVKLKVNGDYFNIVKFLRDIDGGRRFTKLDNALFSTDGKGVLELEADFIVYAFNNPFPQKQENQQKQPVPKAK